MERTSRWTVKDGQWFNGKAEGEFVDAPTLLSFAELLASAPCDGAHPVPRRLLFIDVHEYEALENTLHATGQFANQLCTYDFRRGVGTYFASAFALYLRETLVPRGHLDKTYVVFPDQGAHRRYNTMVQAGGNNKTLTQDAGDGQGYVKLLPYNHILFLHKERVGEKTDVVEKLFYVDADGVEREKKETRAFPNGAYVLIADDFTNSGGTLFKGAKIIRNRAGPGITVDAFVTHFVAQYDRATVTTFVDKLYGDKGQQPPIDTFACTNSIPGVVKWLREEVGKRDPSLSRIHVTSLAPIIFEWVSQTKELLALTEVAVQANEQGMAAVDALRKSKQEGKTPGDFWRSEMWLKSIAEEKGEEKGLLEPLKAALLKPLDRLKGREKLKDDDEYEVYRSAAELYFLQELTEHDVRGLLSQKSVPGDFSIMLNEARKGLKDESSNESLNPKFEFDLKFGDMSYFYKGLESLIGAPRANIRETMYAFRTSRMRAALVTMLDGARTLIVRNPPRRRAGSASIAMATRRRKYSGSKIVCCHRRDCLTWKSEPSLVLGQVGPAERAAKHAHLFPMSWAARIAAITLVAPPPPATYTDNKMPTLPKLEWLLLTDHDEGVKWLWNDDSARELRHQLSSEFNVKDGDDPRAVDSKRKLRTSAKLEEVMVQKNKELGELKVGDEMLLMKEEMLAACLYTGPMYAHPQVPL